MLDLVFWSFVVTLVPIFLAIGSKLVEAVARLISPSAPRSVALNICLRQAHQGDPHWGYRAGDFHRGR